MGGFPQGGLGYGISKGGLGLTSSLGNGVGVRISNLEGVAKSIGGGDVELIGRDIHTDNSYKKGAESKSEAKEEEVASEEANKGYKVAEEFDKAETGQLEKTHHAGHYDTAADSKKADLDEVKKYSDSEAAVKSAKGEAFGKSEGHKKGHKTTGYHNVYHKDEYKKDTSFYDDEHVSAQEESFGTESSHHAKAKGSHEKVEKLDKQFHEDELAKKGTFTNGHQYGVAQGHDREHGEKEHYEKAAEFAKGAKHKAEKEEASSSRSSQKGFWRNSRYTSFVVCFLILIIIRAIDEARRITTGFAFLAHSEDIHIPGVKGAGIFFVSAICYALRTKRLLCKASNTTNSPTMGYTPFAYVHTKRVTIGLRASH